MDWNEPDSTWRRIMVWRAKWPPVIILGALVFAGIIAPLMLKAAALGLNALFRSDEPAHVPSGLYAFMVGMVLVAALYIAHRLPRDRRALRLVPEHDAAVCPRCLRVLEASSGGDDSPSCPRCRATYSRDALVRHWREYPYRLPVLLRGFFDTDRDDEPSRIVRAVRRVRAAVNLELVAFCLFGVVWWVGIALQRPGHWLVNMANYVSAALSVIGIALIFSGWRRRTGSEFRCLKCGYEKGPGAGNRCPECGIMWTLAGTLRRGHRERSRPMILLGVLFLVLSFASPFLRAFSSPSWRYRLVPSAALIEHVASDEVGLEPMVWSALLSRHLAPERRDRIAVVLLARYRRTGFLMQTQQQWLKGQLAHHPLPDDLAWAYRDELIGLGVTSSPD